MRLKEKKKDENQEIILTNQIKLTKLKSGENKQQNKYPVSWQKFWQGKK